MAISTLSDLSAVLNERFGTDIAKAYNRSAILVNQLEKRPGEGNACAWRINVGGQTDAATFVEGASVADSELTNDTYKPATLAWAQYRIPFGVSGLELAAVQSDPGALNVLEEYLEDAAANLARVLNTACYAGTGADKQIAGFAGASAIDSTGTYAGLLRSSYPAVASTEIDANSGELTKDLMDEAEASIFTASNVSPDMIITTPTVAKKYEKLFDTVLRVDQGSGDLAPAIGDMGFTGRNFRGIPVYRDPSCTAGVMYFLRRDQVILQSLPEPVSRPQDVVGEGTVMMDGLGLSLQALAKTGDGSRYQLVWRGQLKVKNPNRCGKIINIG